MDESLNEASEVLHNEKLTASTVRFMNSPPDDLPTGKSETANRVNDKIDHISPYQP
jgi:seryl-tRNA synthetase